MGATSLAPLKAAADRVVVVDSRVMSEAAIARTTYHRRFAAPIGGRAVAINTIGPLAGSSDVQRVERLLRAELTDVRLVPVLDPDEAFDPAAARNVVLTARR